MSRALTVNHVSKCVESIRVFAVILCLRHSCFLELSQDFLHLLHCLPSYILLIFPTLLQTHISYLKHVGFHFRHLVIYMEAYRTATVQTDFSRSHCCTQYYRPLANWHDTVVCLSISLCLWYSGAALKTRNWTSRNWTIRHHIARVDNARLENAPPDQTEALENACT